jgi:hypothetical protein
LGLNPWTCQCIEGNKFLFIGKIQKASGNEKNNCVEIHLYVDVLIQEVFVTLASVKIETKEGVFISSKTATTSQAESFEKALYQSKGSEYLLPR